MNYPQVSINPADIRPGSTLAWLGGRGGISGILSWIIALIDPYWRNLRWQFISVDGAEMKTGRPWHLSQVIGLLPDGTVIVDEATTPRARRIALELLGGHYCIVNWQTGDADPAQIGRFIRENEDSPYSVDAYIWTALHVLTRGWFPRILIRREMCWQRNSNFCWYVGVSWCELDDYPWLPNFCRQVEGRKPVAIPRRALWRRK
jgi:hypothetical protein